MKSQNDIKMILRLLVETGEEVVRQSSEENKSINFETKRTLSARLKEAKKLLKLDK